MKNSGWLKWLVLLLPFIAVAGVVGYLLGRSITPPIADDVGIPMPIDGVDDGVPVIVEAPVNEDGMPTLNFVQEWDSADTQRSYTAAWGDVDNDGDLDLALGNYGGTALQIHFFDRGEFSRTSDIVAGIERVYAASPDGIAEINEVADLLTQRDLIRHLVWGDIDNDGDLDLAVARARKSERNAILLNDGTGKFTDVLLLGDLDSAENSTFALAWGDYDDDGDLDLASANNGENTIYRNMLNQSNDSQPHSPFPDFSEQSFGGDYPSYTVIWAQLNDNPALDLVVASRKVSGEPRVAEYYLDINDNSSGQLTKNGIEVGEGLNLNDLRDMTVTDIDNDNRQEISGLFGTRREAEIRLFELDENEQFVTVPVTITSGFLDAVMLGSLVTETQIIADSFVTTGQTYEIDWVDINRDGRLDLITDSPFAWLNSAAGFVPVENPIVQKSGESRREFVWGDVEGDSDLDVAIINRNGPTLVWLNRTEGSWTTMSDWLELATAESIAWGDYDDDGEYEVAIGSDGVHRVYENSAGVFDEDVRWSPTITITPVATTTAVAWGDADGDGNLDLAVLNASGAGYVQFHPDERRGLDIVDLPPPPTGATATGAQWVDVNRDGALELFVFGEQLAHLYQLNGENFEQMLPDIVSSTWQNNAIADAAWGDVDGDGDADLALVGVSNPVRWYENRGGTMQADPTWQSAETDASSVAWGDINGDGVLDLVTGSPDGVLKVYINDLQLNGPTLFPASASWLSLDDVRACSIELSDIDGDGDLDLVAIGRNVVAIYPNHGGQLETQATTRLGYTRSDATTNCYAPQTDLALADADNDGDLDIGLATGASGILLLNDRQIVLSQRDAGQNTAVTVGNNDVLADGRQRAATSDRALAPARGVATANVRNEQVIPIAYQIAGTDEQQFDVKGFYSIDGGGSWSPAVAGNTTATQNVTSGEHVFEWDVFGSGFVGQSDQVVFRVEALPVKTTAQGQSTGRFETPFVAAQTFPFRVRGLQIELRDADGKPLDNALVYRIPAGRQTGGELLTGADNVEYRSDGQGRLEGFTQLASGDSLVALWPVPASTLDLPPIDNATVYYMSAAPTKGGVALEPIDLAREQQSITLQVSSENPLILFDLDVSLEWDARNDESFMLNLENAFGEASRVLFDVTNGQVALGDVNIYHDREQWDSADIVILADNSLRPSASIGGVVSEPYTKTLSNGGAESTTITYRPGKVQMGPIWDAFGESTADLGDQWDRTLAHELAHYFLFLFDDYLGVNEAGDLGTQDCPISFMTYAFDPSYNEFLSSDNLSADASAANPQLEKCLSTLTRSQTGLDSWGVITSFYPFLMDRNGAAFEGPNNLPLEVTQVKVHEPDSPANTLPSRTLDVREQGASSIFLPSAQGFLIQTQGNDDLSDDRIMALGNPLGGGDRLRVRGAETGDRFCLFDYSGEVAYSGCETISDASGNIHLEAVEDGLDWAPVIKVAYLTELGEYYVQVSQKLTVTQSFPLYVQLYPTYDSAENPNYLAPYATLTPAIDYPGYFTTTLPANTNVFHLRIWEEGEPGTREVLSQFSFAHYLDVQGNPIDNAPGGPIDNAPGGPIDNAPGGPIDNAPGGPIDNAPGGPIDNAPGGPIDNAPGGPIDNAPGGPIDNAPGGPIDNAPGGPIDNAPGGITADGQVRIYNTNDIFGRSGVQNLQTLVRLPESDAISVPSWLTPIGPYFRVSIDPNIPTTDKLRLSYHYLQRDVPKGFEHEKILKLYFLPEGGEAWQRIEDTDLAVNSNTAIASLQGSGYYALLATIALPELEPGWNLVTYPLLEDHPTNKGFESFAFDSIYEAKRHQSGEWIAPVGEPKCNPHLESVETLKFGEVYWIYLDEDATPFLDVTPVE